MAKQEFSPLRSRASRKPWPECPDIVLYRCRQCGGLYQALGSGSGPGPACCGAAMERLAPVSPGGLAPLVFLEYKIVGGFNNNAVQVFWETQEASARPAWIMLRTFTGSYIKYVAPQKAPPLIFPLSDEDAYVYCDRPECERCVFRCKKGFVIYAYSPSLGLVELGLDKVADYFKTRRR